MTARPALFQILDVGSIWLKEFASALSRSVPTISWEPVMCWTGAWQHWTRLQSHADPKLDVRHFPMQRGYARFPISQVRPLAPHLLPLLSHEVDPRDSALIVTTPFYAPVAERWPGPVVYYQTDLTAAYAGVDAKVVRAMDRRLCRVSHVVCPNSERIAAYMIDDAECPESKITIVPNATRESNLYPTCPTATGPLPTDVMHLPRPVAGVIGNLAANMDWVFLRDLVRLSSNGTWLFVGPTHMPVYGEQQKQARGELLSAGGRVLFTGARPYSQLQSYARALDVAVLPYRRHEPTYSGSSTRFYEHLAACRPMIATRGFAELLRKEPLLELVDTAEQALACLNRLQDLNFRDGFERERWLASFDGTWEQRAKTVTEALRSRVSHFASVRDQAETVCVKRA